MKNDPVQSAFAGLDDIPLRTPEGWKQIAKALASKFNVVAAKPLVLRATLNGRS